MCTIFRKAAKTLNKTTYQTPLTHYWLKSLFIKTSIHNLGLPRGLFLIECAWNTSKGRHPGLILNLRFLNHLCPFDIQEQGQYSKISVDASYSTFLSMAEPSHLTESTHFKRLYLWSYSFDLYPDFMTIGEGWDVGGLVNSKLSAMLPLPQQFSTNIRNRVKKNKYKI